MVSASSPAVVPQAIKAQVNSTSNHSSAKATKGSTYDTGMLSNPDGSDCTPLRRKQIRDQVVLAKKKYIDYENRRRSKHNATLDFDDICSVKLEGKKGQGITEENRGDTTQQKTPREIKVTQHNGCWQMATANMENTQM